MEQTEVHRLRRVVLNERRRLTVKLRLNGATIAEIAVQCELGRSAVIRAMQAARRMQQAKLYVRGDQKVGMTCVQPWK
jgi:transposase